MTLAELRKKIDALDSQILASLDERADLVHEVGQLKRRDGLEIYAPEREEQLLQSLFQRSKGRLREKSIRAIYREIMSASLALEKDLTIAYLGPEATWAHLAARGKFGASVKYAAPASIGDVFKSVTHNNADYGVVPIEDSTGGMVDETLDAFMDSDLRICAQILMAPEVNCPEILEDLRFDLPANATRFVVIGHRCSPPTGNDKTSIMFSVQNEGGTLFSALEPFKRDQISMGKIESRPSKRKPAEAFFFADVAGHQAQPILAGAIAELEKLCTFVKILGSYPNAQVFTAL